MRTDKITNYITLFVGIVFFLLTLTIGEPFSKSDIGPRTWPQLLAITIVLLSIFNIVQEIKKSKQIVEEKKSNDNIEFELENSIESKVKESEQSMEAQIVYPKRFWVVLLLLCAYAFSINYVGFIISTSLFTGINMYLMGFKKIKPLLLVSLLIVVLLVVLFPKLLAVPLPRGIGIFRDFSRIFY